jgi:hypothetical protein
MRVISPRRLRRTITRSFWFAIVGLLLYGPTVPGKMSAQLALNPANRPVDVKQEQKNRQGSPRRDVIN